MGLFSSNSFEVYGSMRFNDSLKVGSGRTSRTVLEVTKKPAPMANEDMPSVPVNMGHHCW
jgi:hypothetical protein